MFPQHLSHLAMIKSFRFKHNFRSKLLLWTSSWKFWTFFPGMYCYAAFCPQLLRDVGSIVAPRVSPSLLLSLDHNITLKCQWKEFQTWNYSATELLFAIVQLFICNTDSWSHRINIPTLKILGGHARRRCPVSDLCAHIVMYLWLKMCCFCC